VKKKIKILFLIFSFCLIFLQSKPAFAETTSATKDDVKLEKEYVDGTLKSNDIYSKNKYYSMKSGWAQYSSTYYYDQLTTSEKNLYDALNAMCLDYISSTTNGITKTVDGDLQPMTAFVPYSNMTSNEAYNVALIFMFSEPEYYFLDDSAIMNTTSNTNYLSLGMYSNYLDGTTRSTTTSALKSKLDTWTSQVQSQTGDYAKAKEAHDLIASNVTYNNNDYEQSIISFLNSGTTVCTGYTKMYELLCDAAGLESLCVTSNEHAWNKVEINGAWYNVDCTWDDSDPGIIYTYFAKSDSTMLKGNSLHNVQSYWYTYTKLPSCNSDTVTDLTTYNGVDYAAVYNYSYYIAKYPDLASAFGSDQQKAIAHFVNFGMGEGRQATNTFNVNAYKSTYKDLRQIFYNDLPKYYLHYINYGKAEGRVATNETTITDGITSYNGVDYSSVYKYSDYIENNKDIANAYPNNDVSALLHFINFGMKEGRQAISSFNVNAYRAQNTDLRNTYGSDLKSYYLHYINYGKSEGRSATGTTSITNAATIYNGVNYSPVYNYADYIVTNPDVAAAFPNDDVLTLKHFVEFGMNEGRQASSSFNVNAYRAQNTDLRNTYGSDLKSYYLHYINYGKSEGRSATGTTAITNGVTVYNGTDYSTVYNYNYYIAANPDVAAAYPNDDVAVLKHFVEFGMKEGRNTSADFVLSVYKANYQDLVKAYGDDNASYYMHYMQLGKAEGRIAK